MSVEKKVIQISLSRSRSRSFDSGGAGGWMTSLEERVRNPVERRSLSSAVRSPQASVAALLERALDAGWQLTLDAGWQLTIVLSTCERSVSLSSSKPSAQGSPLLGRTSVQSGPF